VAFEKVVVKFFQFVKLIFLTTMHLLAPFQTRFTRLKSSFVHAWWSELLSSATH
jgi:hypothetical protein